MFKNFKVLTNNALSASTPASEEDKEKEEDIVHLDSSSEDEHNKQDKFVNSINKTKNKLSQAKLQILMDKNRSNYLRGKVQQQQNGSRQLYRINTSSFNNQLTKKPYAPAPTTSTRYVSKTVSEMLNDMINMSVDKTKENNEKLKEQLISNNNNFEIYTSNNNNFSNTNDPPHLEPEEDVVIDNFVNEINNKNGEELILNEPIREESTTFVCQLSSQKSIFSSYDDDDVQIIRDNKNNEENQMEESDNVLKEEEPFCKNCAKEVPLIIKRLDRLDAMVDKMIDFYINHFLFVFFFVKYLSIRNSSTKHFSDVYSDDFQFLEKSIIPTYHFQKSLRRLPIPKLENSCKRYLAAVKAIFSNEETKEMELLVNQFLKDEGPELHKALIEYDRQHLDTSYISEPWFDMYLSARVPCPVNYNPFMMFAPDPDILYNNQTQNLLPQNISWFGAVAFKAFPLDMSQYKSLFGGCRIPKHGKDELSLKTDSKHFVVARKGNFYSVDLFNEKGELHSPDYIYSTLHKILTNKSTKNDESSLVGSLTTLDRNTWADVRKELISFNQNNLQTLNVIEDALFLLCFDDSTSTDPNRLVNSLLCGDDGRNRWFDKCFQLIVDGNGQSTINFEHSWGDGVAVLRLMEEILKDTVENRFVSVGEKVDSSKAGQTKKLEWKLNDSLRSRIRSASEQHIDRCNGLGFDFLEHKNLSKEEIKCAKLSPDAIMQLGIQLAFHSIYGEFVPTYESMRSATTATREAVLAFEKGDKSAIEMFGLIKKCSEMHSQLIKEASMGQGFDRHFLV
ncbi:Carn_acyltransf domain-containing protein [Meloidogyne graminicola]|uniref:Carn_acyltransf domain-containing protein n=1 Tax=Meloidogyne graminicola TaxID=189291 RepID=A0A8T0A4M2_9BILA|nr:Carn_acyltransf domain-containing protein [Meloidogyne graminicola]